MIAQQLELGLPTPVIDIAEIRRLKNNENARRYRQRHNSDPEYRARCSASAKRQYQKNRIKKLEYAKAYHQRTKPERLKTAQRWAEKNRIKSNGIKKAWYQRNRAKAYAATQAWFAAHPERSREYGRMHQRWRRSRKREQMHPTHDMAIERVIEAECKRLMKETGIPHEVDHIIPLAEGGWHHHLNLQALPGRLNRLKNRNPYTSFSGYKNWQDVPEFLWPEGFKMTILT